MFNNEYDVLQWLLENPDLCYELKNIIRLNKCINVRTLYNYVYKSTFAGNIFNHNVYTILKFYSDDIINLYEFGKLDVEHTGKIVMDLQDSYAVSHLPYDVNMYILELFVDKATNLNDVFLETLLNFCKEAHCQSEIVYRSAAKILHKQLCGDSYYSDTFDIPEFEKFVYSVGAGYWEKNLILKMLYCQGYYKLYAYYTYRRVFS